MYVPRTSCIPILFYRINDSQNFRSAHRRYIDRCMKNGMRAELSGRGHEMQEDTKYTELPNRIRTSNN